MAALESYRAEDFLVSHSHRSGSSKMSTMVMVEVFV